MHAVAADDAEVTEDDVLSSCQSCLPSFLNSTRSTVASVRLIVKAQINGSSLLGNQRLDNVAFHIRETIIPALERIG